jgi:hypothetical protein
MPLRAVACAAVLVVAGVAAFDGLPRARAAVGGAQAPPASKRLVNNRVGYSLAYPRTWKLEKRVVSTGFAAAAACQSVRIVDFAPPEDSGPSAMMRQSLVQICWKPVGDGSSLERFMEQTYGDRLTMLFDRTRFAGAPAFRAANQGTNSTLFLQTGGFRLQVVTSVAADGGNEALRSGQVRRILSSFSLTR